MILVGTIVHSGTTSFLHTFDNHVERRKKREIVHMHFSYSPELLLSRYKQAEEVYATYRDPYHVATSWINWNRKQGMVNPIGNHGWYDQWEAWAKFVRMKKTIVVPVTSLPHRLHSKPDTHKLYDMLENGDLETYFKCVPKKAVEFALEQVDSVRDYLPGDC